MHLERLELPTPILKVWYSKLSQPTELQVHFLCGPYSDRTSASPDYESGALTNLAKGPFNFSAPTLLREHHR